MKTGRTHNTLAGFTLIEIMFVVAVIGFLASIAIPNFVKARATAQATTCIAIQKQMAGAKAMAAMDNKWGENVSFSTHGGAYQVTLATYLRPGGALAQQLASGAARPQCPLGYNILWNGIGQEVNCQSGLASHDPAP